MRPQGPTTRPTPWVALLTVVPLIACGIGRAGRGAAASPRELRVERRSLEDVFLLSGELRAVRSLSVVTPRSDGPLQIQWLAEDGAEVDEGGRLVEFDSSNLIQKMEELRLSVQQAVIDREAQERNAAAEFEKKRVAVEKAQVEADKARIDASVPREMRPAAEWRAFQGVWHEAQATLEKARLDREAYAVASRSEIETARATEGKARRELAESERSLAGMSLLAPRAGIFLVGNFWNWGPEGPRKLQPGDRVWPSYPIGKIPDPSVMEVLATLAEADHGRVAPGMTARCILDTYPDQVFTGRVEEVGSVAAEGGRNWWASTVKPGFPVRVSLKRTDPLMRPGLSVRVEVVRGEWTDVLVVPRGAIRFGQDGPRARRAGGAQPVPVSLAACTAVDCVVEEGLGEGDRVSRF